jgi:hypothetical protein
LVAQKPPPLRGSLRSLLRQDEEFLGDLILRCEGEARALKDEVARYATVTIRERGFKPLA